MKIKAVDLVRKIRDEIYEETRSMSPEEQVEYFEKKSIEFRKKYITQEKAPVCRG